MASLASKRKLPDGECRRLHGLAVDPWPASPNLTRIVLPHLLRIIIVHMTMALCGAAGSGLSGMGEQYAGSGDLVDDGRRDLVLCKMLASSACCGKFGQHLATRLSTSAFSCHNASNG